MAPVREIPLKSRNLLEIRLHCKGVAERYLPIVPIHDRSFVWNLAGWCKFRLILATEYMPHRQQSPYTVLESYARIHRLVRTKQHEVVRVAKKNIPMDEDIIDLTELIETGPTTRGRAASAYASAAAAPDEDDFGSILAQAEAAPPSRKVDPHETLDMGDMGGIDDLLESLDIPPQPREKGKGAAEEKTESLAADDELDSVLDDLLGNGKPAKSPEKPAPAQDHVDIDADMDDLLGSFDLPEKDAPEKSGEAAPETVPPPAESLPDLDADLDDILAEMDPPKPVAPPEEPASPPPADIDELDGLFENMEPVGSAPTVEETVSEESMEPPAEEAGNEESLAEDASPEIPQTPPMSPLTADMETDLAMSGEAATTPEPRTEALSKMPADAPLPVQTWQADTLAAICRNLAGNQGAQETLQEFSRELGEQSAHMEDMGSQVLQLSRRILACESKISSARARIASLEKGLESISALDDLLREGTPLNAGFMALISSAIANALKGFNFPAKSGVDEGFNADLEKLDAALWKADQRIAALEKSAAQWTGVEERLAALEKAVAQIQEGNSGITELEAASRGANARILALEKQVEELHAGASQITEKAVAATVAKVLHEEISKLAQA